MWVLFPFSLLYFAVLLYCTFDLDGFKFYKGMWVREMAQQVKALARTSLIIRVQQNVCNPREKPNGVMHICPSTLTVVRWEVDTGDSNEPASLAYTLAETREPA